MEDEMSEWNEVKCIWRRGIGNNEYKKNLQSFTGKGRGGEKGNSAVRGN